MNETIKIAIALECAAKYRETGGNDLMNAVVELRRLAAAERELEALKASIGEPVAWKHDCAVLLTNDVELWIDACPHCGKPRTHPAQQAKPQPVQQEPVGWIDAKALEELEKQEMNWMPVWNRQTGVSPIALYTSPQAAQPLTPEWYARWIRNNYQDHPNIATLCEELTKAAHGITKGTT